MKMKLIRAFTTAVLAAVIWSSGANAQLAKSDFLTPGDGLLVTDQATGLQWLSPYATRDFSVNNVINGNGIYGSGNLLTDYGFSFATSSEVLSMINNNFDSPPVTPDMNNLSSSSGTAAGYTDAANFFAIFGLNEPVTCYDNGWSPCPRTQGFVIDGAEVSQIGMMQFGSNGFVLNYDTGSTANSYWMDHGDSQLGAWLVRSVTGSVPEPSTWALMLLGFGAIGAALRRDRRTRLPKIA